MCVCVCVCVFVSESVWHDCLRNTQGQYDEAALEKFYKYLEEHGVCVHVNLCE